MIPFLSVEAAAPTPPANATVQRDDSDAVSAEAGFAAFLTDQEADSGDPAPLAQAEVPLTEEELDRLFNEAGTGRIKGDPLQPTALAARDLPGDDRPTTGKPLGGEQIAPGKDLAQHLTGRAAMPGVGGVVDGKPQPPMPSPPADASSQVAASKSMVIANADLTRHSQAVEGKMSRPPQNALVDGSGDDVLRPALGVAPAPARTAEANTLPVGLREQILPQSEVATKQALAPPAARPPEAERQLPKPPAPRSAVDEGTARPSTAPALNQGEAMQPHLQKLPHFGDLTDGVAKVHDPASGLTSAMSDRVAPQQAAPGTTASPGAAPDTARHAASQMAVAIAQKAGQPTDIALQPEELGRVRMSLSVVENSVTLTVFADRPETADLLRRHIDVLAQEFRSLGYADINFAFGGEQGGGDETGFADHAEGSVADLQEEIEERVSGPALSDGALDLRI